MGREAKYLRDQDYLESIELQDELLKQAENFIHLPIVYNSLGELATMIGTIGSLEDGYGEQLNADNKYFKETGHRKRYLSPASDPNSVEYMASKEIMQQIDEKR